MLTLARVYDLYIDVDKPGGSPCLLESNGNPRGAANPVMWIVKDIFKVRLHFRRVDATIDADVEVVEQPASWAIVLASLDPDDSTKLCFSATAFTKVETDDDVYYEADLSLDTVNLESAMSAVAIGSYLEFRVDVENQDATNAARLTYQFPVRIQQQVYDGETDPTPAEPQYPSPGAIIVRIAESAALTQDQDYVEVTGMGCTSTPAVIICSVRKPSGGANIWATIVHSSITTDGFRADLSASPPAAGYYLDYFVIQ